MTRVDIYAGLAPDEVVLLHRWVDRWGVSPADPVGVAGVRNTVVFRVMLLRYRIGTLLITAGRAVQRGARP